MSFLTQQIIKLIFLVLGISAISALLLSPLAAQTEDAESTTTITTGCNSGTNSDQYLFCIMQNTYGVLQNVTNLPTYLDNLSDLAYSWLTQDDSDATAQLQEGFSNYGNAALANINTQNSLQSQLLGDLFTGVTTTNLPNANDLTYQSLLNMPFFNPDPRNPAGQEPPPYNPPYNYIKNAAALNISHALPGTNWTGKASDQTKYANYFNTIMSVESFNAYILSGPYSDYVNGGSLNSMQTSLLTEATSSDWFTEIASERIGIVMRQLLMFQSQAFVLMTQLLQTQKQMLTAITLNNSLLVLLNQPNEQNLLQKATGLPPTA